MLSFQSWERAKEPKRTKGQKGGEKRREEENEKPPSDSQWPTCICPAFLGLALSWQLVASVKESQRSAKGKAHVRGEGWRMAQRERQREVWTRPFLLLLLMACCSWRPVFNEFFQIQEDEHTHTYTQKMQWWRIYSELFIELKYNNIQNILKVSKVKALKCLMTHYRLHCCDTLEQQHTVKLPNIALCKVIQWYSTL